VFTSSSALFQASPAVFENIIACTMELLNIDRKKAVMINFVVITVLSLPCALGFNVLSNIQPLGAGSTILDLEDFIVSNLLLPLGSLVYLLFCTSKGYGGDIPLTVGIQSDGTVSGYSVLSISETAGLGMKAKDDPNWGKQFAGKKADAFSVVKDGSGSGDDAKIDAISGATITSKAVTGAMNSCLAYFQSLEGGN